MMKNANSVASTVGTLAPVVGGSAKAVGAAINAAVPKDGWDKKLEDSVTDYLSGFSGPVLNSAKSILKSWSGGSKKFQDRNVAGWTIN